MGPTGHERWSAFVSHFCRQFPVALAAAPARPMAAPLPYEAPPPAYEIAQQPARLVPDAAVAAAQETLPGRLGVAGSAGRVRIFGLPGRDRH